MQGKVQIAAINIADQRISVLDNSPAHELDFTPPMSLFFLCQSEEQLDHF